MPTTPSIEEMPRDAIALCDLLARILYRCLKDQQAHAFLFPCVSEPPSTFSSQEEGQMMQEICLVPGCSSYEMQTTGRVDDCAQLA